MPRKRKKNIFTKLGSLCFIALPVFLFCKFIIVYITNGNVFQMDKIFILGVVGLAGAGLVFKILGIIAFARANKKAPKKSILTLGKIMSVRETGPYVNGYPHIAITLQYELPDGKKIASECVNMIAGEKLAAFQPGSLQLVRYEEDNPEAFVLASLEKKPGNLNQEFNQYMLGKGLVTKELLEVMENGEEGKAIILESISTGKMIHGNPEFFLNLRVTKATGEHYETQQTKVSLAESIDQIALGKVVEVKYSPENPDLVAVKTRFSFLDS